jgi:hypothetical protein
MSVVAIIFSEEMRGLLAAPALPKSVRGGIGVRIISSGFDPRH